jgi:hypothetical protein
LTGREIRVTASGASPRLAEFNLMRSTLIGLFALLLACPAFADAAPVRDLSVEPVTPASVAEAPASLDTWFDRADATYARGQSVRMFVRSGEEGYVTAFSIGPTGDVTRIYPNAYHVDNFISAGGTIEIPGAGARAFVTGPLGEERVRVVFTHSREPVCAPSDLAEAGPFQTVVGGGDALHRDLQVVATHEPSGRLTMIERILHSVSGAPAPDGVVVIVPGQN